MVGYVVKHLGKTHRVGADSGLITLAGCINRDKYFVFEGFSYLNLREGIEIEVEVAEFYEPTNIDPRVVYVQDEIEYETDDEWKLRVFRNLERVLKKEGLI